MTNNKIRFYEELSSNGHVALNILIYDGWLLKFSNGYTGRANSISALYPSSINLEEKIDYCEECYKKQKLPCQFKITESEDDKELNAVLEKRGYEVVTPTDLMSLELKNSNPTIDENAVFFDEPVDEWLDSYFPFEGISDEWKIETFKKMLAKVQVKTIFGAIKNNGKIVACASAAIEHGYMLLQNVVVAPDARGQGFGKKLCSSLIAKAKESGATHSYLQVLFTNNTALNLYSKLGFKKEYTYWYMKK